MSEIFTQRVIKEQIEEMKKKEERLEKEIAEAMVIIFFISWIFTFNLEPKPQTKGATAEGARNK